MDYSLSHLVGFSVFIIAVVSLTVLWALYAVMYAQGVTSIVLHANLFGEFYIELIGLTLAIVFLPVLLYEAETRI